MPDIIQEASTKLKQIDKEEIKVSNKNESSICLTESLSDNYS